MDREVAGIDGGASVHVFLISSKLHKFFIIYRRYFAGC